MLLTYKELFERVSSTATEIDTSGDEEFYPCREKLYVDTPSGRQRIQGVFKKLGTGLKLTLDNGIEIKAEEHHTLQTSTGWTCAKDAKDVAHCDGSFRAIVSKEPINDVEFYDICIDHPHAYYDPNGLIHHNTFTIMKVLKESGLTAGKDYVKLSGKATPVSIYETLFMFRDGGLVIFDDLDSMWGNADATNILKAALDTSPVREISWSSANTINVAKFSDEKKKRLFAEIDKQIRGEDNDENLFDDDDDSEDDGEKKKKKKAEKIKYPSTFEFTGRVIFISNLKKEDFDSAILSRSAKINMDLSPEEILARMKKMLPTLGGEDVPVERKQELLDYLVQMHKGGELDIVTMREFIKGLLILRSGAPNWRELVKYVA